MGNERSNPDYLRQPNALPHQSTAKHPHASTHLPDHSSTHPPPPVPQFEYAPAGHEPHHLRGRTAEDAVRRAVGVPADRTVTLTPSADRAGLEGWLDVEIDGVPAGRVRPHNRMRFRRD